MKNSDLNKISTKNLKKIILNDGNVFHFLKNREKSFSKFGEAYFSFIKYKKIKAWKKHNKMTMNLAVPVGLVKFVFCEIKKNKFRQIIIGESNYKRITVPPKVWFGFQGLSKKESLIINFANIEHSDSEVEKLNLGEIKYKW